MNYPNVLSAVAATTTSSTVNVQNDEDITLIFVCAGHSSGNGVFTVDAMIGGSWVTGIPIIDMNVANTNVQNLTRVLSVTLSANGTKLYALDKHLSVEAIRIVVTVTTDGAYSAHVHTHQRR